MTNDYFEFFSLPRDLNIDPADLEKRFHALSRKWHPDMFARKSPREKEESLEASAILNDAYRTLKDPISRAQYLLKQEGFEIGEQGSKDVPPELLEEVFELNEALEEADLPQLEAARSKFEAMRDALDRDLQAKFKAWDNAHERGALTEIRALLNRRKYITNLIAQTNVPNRV
ncbi:MAG TPA: Fe-S protein assembly co-chaperone HscB [Bryobacteraceae bacterium]|jgi:molecular chaperone HscB|nr:Fe-S protein assembly co-chaperone HscB [Bryobacteraceae bacterium]